MIRDDDDLDLIEDLPYTEGSIGQLYEGDWTRRNRLWNNRYARTHPHRDPVPPNRLTPREVEVMNLLATGLTNHEAADQLRISVRTLENHKESAMQKIGSRRVIRALIRGGFLIPTGGPQL